jgi:PKHD-type hydroxylase
VSQGVQFASYEEGGNYHWHKDEFDQPFGEESPEIWRGLARKITVIVNLTDPSEYQGGQLRMKNTYGDVVSAPEDFERMRQKGSVIVFPSYTPHAVEPVTRGTRHSLVTWVLGRPFR